MTLSKVQRRQAWKTDAFVSFAERLRAFEGALYGGKLLEFRCDQGAGFGFLLEWLRPKQLVAVDVESSSRARLRSDPFRPRGEYGSAGAFDAAFLLAHARLKRALRRVSMGDVARVVKPGGLFVIATLESPVWLTYGGGSSEEHDGEAWDLLHECLSGSDFEISEEHLGANRLLVARRCQSSYRSLAPDYCRIAEW